VNEREEQNRAPIDDVPGCAAPSRFRVLFLSSTVLYLNLNLKALLVPTPWGDGSVFASAYGGKAGLLSCCFLSLVLALYALTCEIRGVGSSRLLLLPLTKSFSRRIILRLNAFQFPGRSGPVGCGPVCLPRLQVLIRPRTSTTNNEP
jgi:hypothetical protein